jgi:predicted RNase H-like HicB family nuclease
VPDLAGCISTGLTRAEVERNIREAIGFHVEGLLENGQQVAEPSPDVDLVDVA